MQAKRKGERKRLCATLYAASMFVVMLLTYALWDAPLTLSHIIA
jgi:hypothetical protein